MREFFYCGLSTKECLSKVKQNELSLLRLRTIGVVRIRRIFHIRTNLWGRNFFKLSAKKSQGLYIENGKIEKCKKLEELFQVTVILTISVINTNYRFPELYGFQALHIHKKSSESRKEICKRRIDAATVRYILYLFGQGYFIFIREKVKEFWNRYLWQMAKQLLWPIQVIKWTDQISQRIQCSFQARENASLEKRAGDLQPIGCLGVPETLTFKTRLRAKPFLWKWLSVA